MGQVNAKSGTVADEVIKEQAKILGQQKNWRVQTAT
jgi:hypothetical protein